MTAKRRAPNFRSFPEVARICPIDAAPSWESYALKRKQRHAFSPSQLLPSYRNSLERGQAMCAIRLFLTFLSVSALIVVSAYAQVNSSGPLCPPGQVSHAVILPGGTLQYGCGAQSYVAHEPADTHPAISCANDSDCPPGPGRCKNGFCGRDNMACNADRDCKSSELCDKSRPLHVPEFLGFCRPRGGKY